MFGLLLESLNEIISRPLALLKTFWLTVVLYFAVLCLLLGGVVADIEAIGLMLVSMVLVASPGAVQWHRHVLTGESVRWFPRLPDLKSLAYAAKLCVTTIFVGMSQKIASSIAQDILLPVYGLATGGISPEEPANVALGVNLAEISIRVLAFLIFAGWMLSLPEGTLEPSMRGFRKSWPDGGKRHFFGALAVLYFGPALFWAITTWTFRNNACGLLQLIWVLAS
jgi:hypothetical protein